jgi:predicted alpha/beta superfamily hydrolase
LAAALIGGCATSPPSVPSITGRVDTETLPSAIVGDSYLIEVRLPPSYDSEPNKTYPTVYQLDGTSFGPEFKVTAGLASGLEREGRIGETIVVGIGYPYDDPLVSTTKGRGRDYVTVFDNGQPGGATNFLRFVTDELIPHIDGKYRTDATRRVLSGHSLGGFMSLHAMLTMYQNQNPNPPFWGFIAGDPSFFEDSFRVFDEEAALHAARQSLPIPLWIEIARFDGAVQQLSFQQFDKRLKADFPDLIYGSEVRDTDHGGAIAPSFQNGLVHIFRGAQ